jgi:hypothetical protein
LSDSTKTTVVDLFSVQFNSTFRVVETLLNDRGQLTDATTLFTENVLGSGGTDDDLGTGRSDSDFDSRVTFFSQFSGEKLVQLSVEDSIADELGRGVRVGRVDGWMDENVPFSSLTSVPFWYYVRT